MNPYINDILAQPGALRDALNQYPAEVLGSLRSRVHKGEFDRIVRPLAEILPLQMLSILMAARNGFEPGKFRHIVKITTQE